MTAPGDHSGPRQQHPDSEDRSKMALAAVFPTRDERMVGAIGMWFWNVGERLSATRWKKAAWAVDRIGDRFDSVQVKLRVHRVRHGGWQDGVPKDIKNKWGSDR